MGSLYLAFEQLKKKLEAEGLFREEHKQKLPALPRRIGVITSPTGAALQDILTTVRQRYPYVKIVVAESLMQGDEAPADIARAIDRLNAREEIELIIIARGGGSFEDLAPFNSETVARAIFHSRRPVISAVGHGNRFYHRRLCSRSASGHPPPRRLPLRCPAMTSFSAGLIG